MTLGGGFRTLSKLVVLLIVVYFFAVIVMSVCSPSSSQNTMPSPYYASSRNMSLTFADLDAEIDAVEMPYVYNRSVFDCSEGSAWMEWYLESKGYNTSIVVNRFPTGLHAYVKVDLPDGGIHLINSVPGNVHYYSNDSYYLYIHYYDEFVDIYDALNRSVRSEWDWWEAQPKLEDL